VRIPLDYYRILGLPLAASEEQLRQAYSDRIVQLPRREYSQAAITSRKQLIEEAYVVLSDSKERSAYDQLYLAHAYDPDRAASATVAIENLTNNGNFESQTLGIEISQDELVGALLLLQELGEYEQVLQLGRPYLINKNEKTGGRSSNISPNEEFSELAERPDIILTVALACLELGREQWQQGHYENAAISLETGQDLLVKEGLFPSVRAEIQGDLYKLRPYRILELLALPEEKTAERRQGLDLLEGILDERGGIDGTFDDQSGLNIDDFLRFIQQLRNHLTVAEQHKLFEVESKRPSAVATYLAVYALIARGFAQRQPALVRQAKQMLMRLGKRQDVHLEQSLCALLLGQTEEASRALELSQEYEALAFIRENSQDSPDLLPGLCLYGERWLQNEVFPHFRDLANQQVSLKDYFANSQVQAYLEGLPTDAQTTNEWAAINRQSVSPPQQKANSTRRRSNSTEATRQLQQSKTPDPELQETPTPQKPEYPNFSSTSFAISSSHATSNNGKAEAPVPLSTAERTGRETNNNLNGNPQSAATTSTQKVRKRKRPQAASAGRNLDPRQSGGQQRRRSFIGTPGTKIRLLWMVFGSLAGILVLWLFVSTTFGLLKNLFSPGPSLQGKQLMVHLNDPIVPIPEPNSKVRSPDGPLTEETAEEVVETWLATKAAALGVDHDIPSLEQILAGTALSQWQLIAQQDKADNRYRKYEHSLKVESVDTIPSDQNQAVVEATVKELAQFYENGQINQKKSYNEGVRVRYALVRQEGVWRIREMSIVNKISQLKSEV
jgi:curved DNA-binding protein CbpA